MHAGDVEATTASLVAALRPDGASTLWAVEGHPCEHPYVEMAFGDAARLLSSAP